MNDIISHDDFHFNKYEFKSEDLIVDFLFKIFTLQFSFGPEK